MKEKFGFLNLAKKTLAVITASLTTLNSGQSKPMPDKITQENENKNLNTGSFQKKILKPKLVLRLVRGNNVVLSMHESHSSHSSHVSSSPSSGHSSHMSSSPTYPSSTPSNNSGNSSGSSTTIPPATNTLPYYLLGSRVLYNGCVGTDVKEMQEKLLALGYSLIADGSFGDGTELAVKKFQQDNYLTVDGTAGPGTLSKLQSK